MQPAVANAVRAIAAMVRAIAAMRRMALGRSARWFGSMPARDPVLVEPFRGVSRPRDMWRSVALLVVVAGVLAGCSLGGGSGAGSASSGTATYARPSVPVHKIRVPFGQTRTLAADVITYPLTVICPRPTTQTFGSGLTQVIRSPLRNGGGYFGDSIAGTSITIVVQSSGAWRLTCS
jgi:hypothetical protein